MIQQYTDEQMAKLRAMFYELYPIKDIANAIGRSEGSVTQQIFKLRLKRDKRMVRLVNFHGRELMKFSPSFEAMREAVGAKKEGDKVKKIKQRSEQQGAAIERLRWELPRLDRNDAITRAYKAKATLAQIGAVVGVSKQRISFIIRSRK